MNPDRGTAQEEKYTLPARLRDAAWFWAVVRHYLPIYGHVILAALVINVISLTMPLYIMNVYDRVIPNQAFESLWVLSLGATLAFGMDYLLRNARTYFVDLAGRNADVILLGRFMDVLLDMRFEGPRSTGALVAQTREFEYLREFFASTTLLALIDAPFVLLFMGLIFLLAGPLVLIPLLALPCMVIFALVVQLPFRRAAEAQLRENMGKNSLLVEISAALETIKSAQLQAGITRRWDKAVDSAAVATMESRRLGALAGHSTMLISTVLNVALVVAGVYAIAEGKLSMGALIACVILLGRVMGPLMQLAGLINQLQKAGLALKALHKFMLSPLENPPDPEEHMATQKRASAEGTHAPDMSGPEMFPAVDVSVRGRSILQADLGFEKMYFRYPGQDSRQWALENVNLRIRHGEHVGVLGATGSGKSTLARLALGLYPPTEGAVLLGQVDMARLPMRAVRSRIGFLPQEICLFSGTIRENLSMAWAEPPSEEELLHVAELAGVLDFARLHPLGLDMVLGERGAGLSGGQAQSVALARALARMPEILVLDEPTSNLDEEAEKRLKARLKPMLQGRTLLLFTHRLSMLELVDRVIVLEGGRVVKDGAIAAVVRPN